VCIICFQIQGTGLHNFLAVYAVFGDHHLLYL
jgi:hypothetical protein